MNQMINFNKTSLDPEKKTLTDRAQETTCVHLKRKSWLSLAIEDNVKKNPFYGCFVALEKPYP
jgi:hypothetical protein